MVPSTPEPNDPLAEATPYAPQPWIPDGCPQALIGRPAELIAAVVADLRAGKPISRIIRSHSISSRIVRAAATEIGWKPRKAESLSDDETERLRSRYVGGDSIHAIARDLGIHHQQVPAALRSRGWLADCAKERARRQRERRAQASRRGPGAKSKRKKRALRDQWWRPPRQAPGAEASPQRHAYGIAQRANELWQEGLPAERIAAQVGVTRQYLEWIVQLYRRIDPTWFVQRAAAARRRSSARGVPRPRGPSA